ncbi:MAG: pyridoxamine 5'-phosphate oxidase family protein [Ancalomicrobiaceae bacterium]|nr:pyridoxamine 5'-phosphate oxidase family protein [Ancalomicrobiaceae bacterium]
MTETKPPPASDAAFTPSVKAIQARKGSRRQYARIEDGDGWPTHITPDLAAFISAQTSVFLATATLDGQPYVQHRGGPRGFLHVIDETTIAFADFTGNRQFITLGNLADNPKALLFLLDYATRQRVKIWGEGRVVEDDADLTAKLMPADYRARPSQVIVFKVLTWDANCPQHIPQRLEASDVEAALAARDARIRELEAEVRQLRAAAVQPGR